MNGSAIWLVPPRDIAAIVIALVCTLFTTACHPMTRTIAERCVLIDVHGEQDQELIPGLDAFATEHLLTPDRSHPLASRYQAHDGQRLVAEMNYRIGMGPHGAVLTLFRYDEKLNEGLPKDFDVFVQEEIAPRYKVTQCVDVSGFKTPEIYR